MHIERFPLGPLYTNCYMAHNDTEAVVIDAADDPAPLLAYMKKHSLRLTHIVNTHMHFDHVGGNAALSAATGVPILAGKDDDYLLAPEMGGRDFGLPDTPPFIYTPVTTGTLQMLGVPWELLATPGHTPGGVSYYCPSAQAVFAGDVLFCRSVGRTDLPGGDADALRHSVQEVLFALPPDTVVYPGHGPYTTIGEERSTNPFFRLDS